MTGVISYLVFFATVASILAIAALGLNLQWGNTGLFNGGVAAFFGAGAYGTLLLGGTPQPDHIGGFELFYPLALAGGVLIAGVLAWIVGILTLKLRYDYLAIATFGVAIAMESVVRNATWLSGGAQGMRGFERPLESVIGHPFVFNILFFAFSAALLAAVYVALERIIRSPFGRLLRAIREDEEAARSLGKSPQRVRLTAFVTGSMIMGLAGGLYATFYAYVSPQDVRATLTFQIWANADRRRRGQQPGCDPRLLPDLGRLDGQRLGAFAPGARRRATLHRHHPVYPDRHHHRRDAAVAASGVAAGKTRHFAIGEKPAPREHEPTRMKH